MQYIDCSINPISRQVSYPGAVIVQRDTNVEALRFHYSLQAEHELENDSIRVMVKTAKEIRGFNAENVRIETNDGGDEELVFEHTITRYETEVPGQINVSVCGNQISGDTITEAWHTLNMSFQVGSSVHTDSDEGEDSEETKASNAEKIAALQTLVDAITSGRPIPVDAKSKMTDTSAIYLYTGNETGEQHNYWYYHDGTTWVPGSEYGGITIDDELSSTSENAVQNKVIKAKYDELNGRLHDELYSTTVSDIAPFIITQGERVTKADGSFEEITGWERTNYIDVDGYISLSVETEYTLWNCAVYKSDYSMLSFMSITPTMGTILLPTNAKYFVMSVSSPRLTGVTVNLIRHSYNNEIDAKLAELAYKAEYTVVPAQYTFVQGALSSADGSIDTSSTRRISSTFIPIVTAKMQVHIDVKYQSIVFFYSAETGGYKSNIGFRDGDYVIGEDVQIPADARLIRISLRNKANPNSNISPSDIQTGEVTIQYISHKVGETELAKYNDLFVPPALPNIMWVCRDSRVRNDVPPNSPQAIKLTAYNQYDRVRFSVTKTADVTPTYVAVHDVTINGLAVNPDGTAISGTVNTADCTLAQLNAYDWGLKFGTQYAGMTVPMLDNCLKLASIYGLRVALDIKWAVDDNDIDNLTAMLAKYGQTDAIFFAVNPINAAKFKAKNKRFSYLYAGTYEQMQMQEANLLGLLTGYNHIYLANRPLGTAPTMDIINFACVNNFDIMYSPIEGMSKLTTLGFDKGITLMECHYIENIKKSVMDYADSLID